MPTTHTRSSPVALKSGITRDVRSPGIGTAFAYTAAPGRSRAGLLRAARITRSASYRSTSAAHRDTLRPDIRAASRKSSRSYRVTIPDPVRKRRGRWYSPVCDGGWSGAEGSMHSGGAGVVCRGARRRQEVRQCGSPLPYHTPARVRPTGA